MDSSNDSKRAKFATVLISRETTEAPTDLEIKLRQCAQKLKVVPSLAGGAKVLFPTSNTTVAVRVYDAVTIAKMEERVQQTSVRNQNLLNDYFDVNSFRDSFKHSIIFFVLTNELILDQLGRLESVVNTLQRRMSFYDDVESTASGKKKGNVRVFMVSDIESILHTVSITLNSLTKEKCALKEKFFLSQAKQNFLPDIDSSDVKCQNAVAEHVANMFRSWSENIGISTSDANVIMNVLGSLDQILAVDERVLEDVPVDSSVKKQILQFFRDDRSFETKDVTSRHSVQPCSSDVNNFADFCMQRRKRDEWNSISSHQTLCSQNKPNVHPQEEISRHFPLPHLGGSRLHHGHSHLRRTMEQPFEGNMIVPALQFHGNHRTSAQYYGQKTSAYEGQETTAFEGPDYGNYCNTNENYYSY